MHLYNKIVLIGMRGCGKSHMGSCIADELNWPKIDMDDEIETLAGKTIPAIIAEEGWDKFRDLEFIIAKKVSKLEKVIISTGGGAITFERNREVLQKNALTVFLFATKEELLNRLKGDTSRPSLKEGKTLAEEISEVWKERGETYFQSADIVFQARDNLAETKIENVAINGEVLGRKIKSVL